MNFLFIEESSKRIVEDFHWMEEAHGVKTSLTPPKTKNSTLPIRLFRGEAGHAI